MEREEESKAATHEEQVLQDLPSPQAVLRFIIIIRVVVLVKGGHLRFGCASEWRWRCVDNNGIWFWYSN